MTLTPIYPIVCSLLCNGVAQLMKPILYYLKYGKWEWKYLISSGGFPSSHSSTVTGLAMAVGIIENFNSTLFAVTAILAFIVMYDACHVRYYSGKNIELTQRLIQDLSEAGYIHTGEPIYNEKLKSILGHKIREVLGGFLIGLIVPFLVLPLFIR